MIPMLSPEEKDYINNGATWNTKYADDGKVYLKIVNNRVQIYFYRNGEKYMTSFKKPNNLFNQFKIRKEYLWSDICEED